MKIAIIQPRTPYYIGGSEKVSIKHAEFLAKKGHQINYYTSDIPASIKETNLFSNFISGLNSNITIQKFRIPTNFESLYSEHPDPEHVRWITESIAFNREIYEKIIHDKPDIILSYYLPDNLFKPEGIPNVIYISGYSSSEIAWYKAFIQFCTASISISSIVSKKWENYTKNINLNYNLPTGVDYPLVISKLIPVKTKYNLVFAGRLIERKGLTTLLSSFKTILETRNDITLWVLGDGEGMKENIQQALDLGISENVQFAGMVNNPYDYFNIADICIFPSHCGDGLMGTVLESMAAGKAVIATTKNGNEDVIQNGINGILVEPKDHGEIAKSINYLLDNDNARLVMGKRAQEYIEKNLTWEKHVERLQEMFNDILEKFQK